MSALKIYLIQKLTFVLLVLNYLVYKLALQDHLWTEEIFHVMKQLMYDAKGY